MIPPLLPWTLLTALIWTAGSSKVPSQDPVKVLYPPIDSSENIECDCGTFSCDNVFWFHTVPSEGRITYIGKSNNADRSSPSPGVNQTHYKFSKRGTSAFVLRIINVTEKDTGIYSCVLLNRTKHEMFNPGITMKPGGQPPTSPPTTTKSRTFKTFCPPRQTEDGCSSSVLWPLVAVLAGLALGLLCMLYYFSRLPKKCHHHFVKKRLMT